MTGQEIEEAKNKALDTAEEQIVQLTTRVSITEEKTRRPKEAARPHGTHDGEAGPSTTQALLSPPPLPSQASVHYQEWEHNLLSSVATHLTQPSSHFDLHYQPHLPYAILKFIQKNCQTRLLPDIPSSNNNTYDPTTIPEETIADIIANQPLWQPKWFNKRPADRSLYY